MKELIGRSWKTTLSAVLLAVFTLMYATKHISTQDYLVVIGSITTIIGLFAKDSNATHVKDNGNSNDQ